MPDADAVLKKHCELYSGAVNASDSTAYSKLFTDDAIWMPPGSNPIYGREAIREREKEYDDEAKWSVTITPRDALALSDDWIYGIADVDAHMVAHADGATSDFRLNVTWLLQNQPTGEWLARRQMWNPKPG